MYLDPFSFGQAGRTRLSGIGADGTTRSSLPLCECSLRVMQFPQLELPTFLRPLLLIPYYQHQIAESIKEWIDGGNDKLVPL